LFATVAGRQAARNLPVAAIARADHNFDKISQQASQWQLSSGKGACDIRRQYRNGERD